MGKGKTRPLKSILRLKSSRPLKNSTIKNVQDPKLMNSRRKSILRQGSYLPKPSIQIMDLASDAGSIRQEVASPATPLKSLIKNATIASSSFKGSETSSQADQSPHPAFSGNVEKRSSKESSSYQVINSVVIV